MVVKTDSRLKIVYVIDCFAGMNGGTEMQLFRLIKGMVTRGHEVELYVLSHTDFTKNLSAFPCSVHCLYVDDIGFFNKILALWRFRQSLVSRKFDVVHGFFNDTAVFLPPLMTATGIRCFTSRRDMGIWYSKKKLAFLWFSGVLKNRVICNSRAVADFTKKMEKRSEKDILVIYNGIDPVTKHNRPRLMEWMPNQFFDDGLINVVLLANVRPVKRIEDLIEAAARLKSTGLNIQYYLLGNLFYTGYFKTLKEMLRQHQLQERFHFVGPVAAPRDYLPMFDIGVLTSASEGFSNSIMEYQYAGLPVIASNVGGNPELIIDGYNGLLYEPSDLDKLADHIFRIVSDEALSRRVAKNARNFVERFSVASMIDCHEKAYRGAYNEVKKVSALKCRIV